MAAGAAIIVTITVVGETSGLVAGRDQRHVLAYFRATRTSEIGERYKEILDNLIFATIAIPSPNGMFSDKDYP